MEIATYTMATFWMTIPSFILMSLLLLVIVLSYTGVITKEHFTRLAS